jgi:hypothetical protein
MRTKLPGPGVVGAPASDHHARAAASYVARCIGTEFTEAYLELARIGRVLDAELDEPMPGEEDVI